MRNFSGDSGIDVVLAPADGSAALPLATMEGHFQGPALAWPELITAAEQPDPDLTPAKRLLSLLPVCADATFPATRPA